MVLLCHAKNYLFLLLLCFSLPLFLYFTFPFLSLFFFKEGIHDFYIKFKTPKTTRMKMKSFSHLSHSCTLSRQPFVTSCLCSLQVRDWAHTGICCICVAVGHTNYPLHAQLYLLFLLTDTFLESSHNCIYGAALFIKIIALYDCCLKCLSRCLLINM